MIKLNLKAIADILNARLVGDEDICVENISTDTRQSVEKGLFFALKGENFDAHNYLDQAIKQGCVAVVVEREMDINVPQLIVKDGRLALGQLAQWLKAKINPKTIAITGSAGKTTVKEMCAKILQNMTACADEVLFTFGNLNNDLGVPLTLLRLNEHHKFAVIEQGANHLGEIAYTTRISNPDVAVINNIGSAHLGEFGGIEAVRQAKSEIYANLKENATALINLDLNFDFQAVTNNKKIATLSLENNQADFYAKNIEVKEQHCSFCLVTPQGEIDIKLSVPALCNVKNAITSAALCFILGADLASIKQGLENFSGVKGRLESIKISEHLTLINDAYNANVESFLTACDTLKQQQGMKILIAGDMKELGESSLECHQKVGDYAKHLGFDYLLSVGDHSRFISQNQGCHFEQKDALFQWLDEFLATTNQKKIVILIKGSRSMKMEDILTYLQQYYSKEVKC